MTATILLIRHAAHLELGRILSGRRPDVALSPKGLEQAEILGDLLGTQPIAAVHSSPRQRAWYTARDIADPHGLAVSIAEGLDEVDFGSWAGMAFDALQAEPGWQAWNESRSTARCPGGETMAEAAARAVAAVEDIAAEAEGKTVAAVTHCDIIRGILAHYLGLPLDHLLRFDVDPASLSRIEVGAWGGRVGSINERLYQ
ncbi:MAG TPA: histidine phosphatase family protein [Allosphingosinicella sp.]|nr:histidine phosphatase family protein [Allosphingosinicella sp.]